MLNRILYVKIKNMEERIAVIAVIVSDASAVEKVNSVFHEFRDCVAGRLGLPFKDKGLSVISVVVSAPQQIINSLSGKLGMIEGVKSKVLTAQ